MKRYSFMIELADDIATALDAFSRGLGTGQARAVEYILSDYLANGPPEGNAVARYILRSLDGSERARAQRTTHGVAMKSWVRHEYRPELRFSLQLSGSPDTLGQLRLALRASDLHTLRRFAQFARDWMELESHYIGQHFAPGAIAYTVEEGLFTRTLLMPSAGANLTDEQLGEALGAYMRLMDTALKLYIANPGMDRAGIEPRLVEYVRLGVLF